ncbi:MAG: DNA phosphorothioation system sulfurtransferase DndC [Flavobacteriia bacterium]|nr:DNA phosphorothioation system sulfurtransferase DndC [Flavobacteriia bacterium]OIP46564.1 MAG: sulfurtransferase [Flavobacteriaceae bacterium CG2_30_31_66]PIV97028.1 MAG: DNA phosphorothioation system sulfurtransferase DndC [Flavobacteriaceae bacterium CG17_big_fil_post_rev_8_21_14_2_50_31_13]PIY16364.1 MAG: DNA phosphorothioation system sulfurtransferase DndC [Flavobacteriaceae bacterium CG_4_10_14_3_um_filter_31_253]PIZ12239.1 MAG: DNA phosphorothioation system sulfurtransferase DndC [Flav
MKNKKVEGIISEIIDQYAFADKSDRPWIIGFSGGKDSTVLLMLVWIALLRIRKDLPNPYQLRRKVYIVCNDTMVENPIISNYVEDVLNKITEAARDQDLPIIVKKTTPKLEETFWINVIGKGYPVPNNSFRWCTDKLKIRPTSNFLIEQIDEKGEAIVLLGTRYDESATRERSIRKHEVTGSRLSKHQTTANTYVYAPIKEMIVDEIWYIINTVKSPWGFDNNILFKIYSDASADDYECPTVVVNKEHNSCGQSRFGCWTCTVVKNDKSMSSLVNNGQNWMEPLLAFRNRLVEGRNISENRSDTRRNGQEAVREDGTFNGNYTFQYRYQILKDLLLVQKEIQKERPHITLINNQELIAIQVTWNRDGYFDKTVGDLYKEIYNKEISTNNIKSLDDTERRILREVCEEEPGYYHLIDNLIALQETKTLMITKYGLHNDVEKRIENFVNENGL